MASNEQCVAQWTPSRASDYRIHRVYDYGVDFLRVGSQVVKKGDRTDPAATILLQLDGEQEQVTQSVGFIRLNGRAVFRWGCGQALAQHNASQTSPGRHTAIVIDSLQRCIWDPGSAFSIKKEVAANLRGWIPDDAGFEWVFSLHLRHIRRAVKAATKKAHTMWTAHELAEMEVLELFAVPENQSPASLHILSGCLRDAGFPEIRYISQTLAASLWHLHQDPAILVPHGNGSVDQLNVLYGNEWHLGFVSYLLRTRRERQYTTCRPPFGAEISIVANIGDEELPGLGSAFIDYAKTELINHNELEHVPLELSLAERELNMVLSCRFASWASLLLSNNFRELPSIMPSAREGMSASKLAGPLLNLRLTRNAHLELLRTYSDKAASSLEQVFSGVRLTSRMPSNSVPRVILSGRLFENDLLSSRISCHLQRPDYVTNSNGSGGDSVVRGGMAHFQPLPSKQNMQRLPFGYGIVRIEPYDVQYHSVVSDDPDLILKEDNKTFVRECWHELLPVDNATSDFQKGSKPAAAHSEDWQIYYVTEDKPYLAETVYVTRRNLRSRMPISTKLPRQSEQGPRQRLLIEGVEQWGEELQQSVPLDLLRLYPRKLARSPVHPDRPAAMTYEVLTQLTLRMEGLSVYLDWKVAGPEHCDLESPPSDSNCTVLGTSCLHHAKFPAVISYGATTPAFVWLGNHSYQRTAVTDQQTHSRAAFATMSVYKDRLGAEGNFSSRRMSSETMRCSHGITESIRSDATNKQVTAPEPSSERHQHQSDNGSETSWLGGDQLYRIGYNRKEEDMCPHAVVALGDSTHERLLDWEELPSVPVLDFKGGEYRRGHNILVRLDDGSSRHPAQICDVRQCREHVLLVVCWLYTKDQIPKRHRRHVRLQDHIVSNSLDVISRDAIDSEPNVLWEFDDDEAPPPSAKIVDDWVFDVMCSQPGVCRPWDSPHINWLFSQGWLATEPKWRTPRKAIGKRATGNLMATDDGTAKSDSGHKAGQHVSKRARTTSRGSRVAAEGLGSCSQELAAEQEQEDLYNATPPAPHK